MLQLVDVGHKPLADYASLATRGLMDEIHALAEPLAGKRVVHLSATAFGGGVAALNHTPLPLLLAAPPAPPPPPLPPPPPPPTPTTTTNTPPPPTPPPPPPPPPPP